MPESNLSELTPQQLERYARHVILDEVGEEGQLRLLASKVLIVGAGGLGAPLGLYLAASGIGRIGVLDDDHVELSNLQRQIAYSVDDIGKSKAEALCRAMLRLNPDIDARALPKRLNTENADEIISDFDLIADGSDNFATRLLVNDAAYRLKKTWVSAALLRFEGQITTFKPHLGDNNPCYRCLYPETPSADFLPRCEQAGLLGSVAGLLAAIQGTEIVKEILGLGDSLSGRLLLIDALRPGFQFIKIKKSRYCFLCSDSVDRI